MSSRRLSRRDFLKTVITGTGLMGLESLLSGCEYDLSVPLPAPSTSTPAIETQNPVGQINRPDESESTLAPTETSLSPTGTAAPIPDMVVVRSGEPEDLVRRALEALGGMSRFVPDGANVVVKPNICVASRSYDYAATTNPWVVGALVKLALEAGAASVKVIDNPFNGTQKQAYLDSGIQEQVLAAGGEMVGMDSRKYIRTENPAAKFLKLPAVHEAILNADVLINVPIAKNHGSEARLTLGMKNLMGIVRDRGAMHASLNQSIADLAALVRPQLTVIDAVRILTANGPRGGRLADVQKLDTVIASPDIVAADSYAATLFGISPDKIGYIRAATELGLGRSDLENLNILEL
jgi:uncharacterized protein (DUF362 family)